MFLIDVRLKYVIKAVVICSFVFDSAHLYKTQEMCNKIVSEDPFMLKYCHDRYKTQGMCNKSVDDFLPAFKFVPDWFVTSKTTKKLFTVLCIDDDILF